MRPVHVLADSRSSMRKPRMSWFWIYPHAQASAVFDDAEFFLIARVFFGAVFCAAGLKAFDQFFRILHLGLVFENSLEFDFPHVGDVEGYVGLHTQRAPDLFWHVRLKSFLEQFREIRQVAGGREDRIEHNGVQLALKWDLGDLQLDSITAFDDIHEKAESPNMSLYEFGRGFNDDRWKQVSQELRLSSAKNQPISWIVGTHLFHEQLDSRNDNGLLPKPYTAGSWGPSAAIALAERDGVTWHE